MTRTLVLFATLALAGSAADTFAAQPAPREGNAYILRLDGDSPAVSVKRRDGSVVPFLSGLAFDAAAKDWKNRYRVSGMTVESRVADAGRAVYAVTYAFTGPEAERIAVSGTIEAYADWLKCSFEATYRGEWEDGVHRRLLFRYPAGGLALLPANAEDPFPGRGYGIRMESRPSLPVFHAGNANHANLNPPWEKGDDGVWRSRVELAFVPYDGPPPRFDRLSDKPREAALVFDRPYNILLADDPREATLHFINRRSESFAGEAVLTVRDHRRRVVSERRIGMAFSAEPGQEQCSPLTLYGERQGYFEAELAINGEVLARRAYCVLPPSARAHKDGSIFGGMLYPWAPKASWKLDLMNWAGMSVLRQRGRAVLNPQPPEGRIFTAEEAKPILDEYADRGLEPITTVAMALDLPPGSYRRAEGVNEENAKRLPVDYAERMKIDYVKAKRHDPNLEVGSTGLAGIDTHWLEELHENGGWDHMDALYVHLHCFPRAPEVNGTMTKEFWLHDRVTLLRELMDRFGDKPVYDSENGYLTRFPERRVEKYPLRSVSESPAAAAFMVRSYLQCLAYGLKNKMWFTVDSYGGFGLLEEGQPRPGYPAYAAMTHMLDGARYVGELLSPGRVSSAMDKDGEFSRSWFGQATPGLEKELLAADRDAAKSEADPNLKPYLYIRAFRDPAGRPILAAWATLKRKDVVKEPIATPAWEGQQPGVSELWNGLPMTAEPDPVPVRFNVGASTVEVADMMGNRRPVATADGFLTLDLDDEPQFVFGVDPKLLAEAEGFNLRLFPEAAPPAAAPKTLIQCVLPAEGNHPARKAIYDKPNLSARWPVGDPTTVKLRLTNLGDQPETGTARLELPKGWRCQPREARFTVPAGAEGDAAVRVEFRVTPNDAAPKAKVAGVVVSDRQGRIAASVMNVEVVDPNG